MEQLAIFTIYLIFFLVCGFIGYVILWIFELPARRKKITTINEYKPVAEQPRQVKQNYHFDIAKMREEERKLK